ncbi:MAG: FkbM family methyltransferase [Chloroflexaceae bacterium]
MPTKTNVKQLIEDLAHTYIFPAFPRGMLPNGLNLYYDMKQRLPEYRAGTIFDVGANIGQSAKKFLKWFPQAQIYCFEPVAATCAELRRNVKGQHNIQCFHLALGAGSGKGQMLLQGSAEMFFLTDDTAGTAQPSGTPLEEVAIVSIDDFCANQNLTRINYLKIDTDGYDLEVLKGAERMVQEQRIDLVQVEVSMNSTNTDHVSFEILKHYLEERNYLLFGIYDQKPEWTTGEPQLRRTNPVFLAQHVILGQE